MWPSPAFSSNGKTEPPFNYKKGENSTIPQGLLYGLMDKSLPGTGGVT